MKDDFETNIKLIQIVQSNPCIYDQTRSDYSNRNKQDKVWGEIAQQLNEPVAACRERWKNIRGRYAKQMKKPPQSGSATTSKKPYYLAEYLTFLDTFIRSRTPVGNVSAETDELHSSDVTEEQTNSILDISDGDEGPFRRHETPVLTDTSAPSTPEPSAGSSSQSCYRRKNKVTATLSELNRSAISYFEEKKKRQHLAQTIQDPDEAFLKSVLPDMKNMTEAQKRNFKVAVLRVAGEILNQPVVTPPSILPLGSVTRQNTESPGSRISITPYSCSERREQEGTHHWNESIFLPQYSVVSQATNIDSPAPDSNQNIDEISKLCDF